MTSDEIKDFTTAKLIKHVIVECTLANIPCCKLCLCCARFYHIIISKMKTCEVLYGNQILTKMVTSKQTFKWGKEIKFKSNRKIGDIFFS